MRVTKCFEDFAWMFNSNLSNRSLIRQNFDEAALLWKAVKMSTGPILEIGTYKGGSTLLIAGAAEERTVVSIDIEPCKTKMPENVLLVIGDSHQTRLPLYSYGLVFIDGDHSYQGVKADVLNFWNNLTLDGYLLFHDAVEGPHYSIGVKRFCDELVKSNCVSIHSTAGSSLLLQKITHLLKL